MLTASARTSAGEATMDESSLVNRLARQLYAMDKARKKPDLVESLRNEKYQRTFTDVLFKYEPRPRERVTEDPSWVALANK